MLNAGDQKMIEMDTPPKYGPGLAELIKLRALGLIASVLVFLSCLGCFGSGGVDLRPTVKELGETLKLLRESDYEAGRVKFSENEAANAKLLAGTLQMIREAEANAKKALELAKKER